MKLKYRYSISPLLERFVAVPELEEEDDSVLKKVIILDNGTTRRIFELLQDGMDAAGIADVILEEYDVERSVLCRVLDSFLSGLKQKGILED